MNLNKFVDIAQQVTGTAPVPENPPTVDRNEQVTNALEIARRQGDKSAETKPIPALGVVPVVD